AKYFNREDLADEPGGAANDNWSMSRGGFRMDWDGHAGNSVTFQGDYYGGNENEVLITGASGGEKVSGGNLLTRWDHEFEDGSAAHLQVYYDRVQRKVENIIRADRDTVDIELQHRFSPRAGHTTVVGAGYRVTIDDISSAGVSFSPESRTDHLVSGFIQDEVAVIEDWLSVTVGSKFEHNDYSGWEFQPSGRALLTPHDRHSLWAAISRAVRTPSRADNDVAITTLSTITPPDIDFINGNTSLEAEDLLAYELGYRGQLLDSFSLDLAAYYNDYDDLRSTDVTATFPCGVTCRIIDFGNNLDAVAWGFEADGTWSATSFWQISGGYTYRRIQVDRSSSTDLAAAGLEGDTPRHQFHLLSRLNLPHNLEFDTSLYFVDALRSQPVRDYTRVDLRLGWRPTQNLELSLVGQNLLESRHEEFESGLFSMRSRIPRSVYGMVTYRR
ncbi:MAG: TonB-dependent receptor, partial [Myxococcota bacterium]